MTDLIDSLRVLSARIPKMTAEGLVKTEEGTKNALVMPFIQMLGYNVFDPTEVTPELNADVGIKKGEKVDYAVLRDSKPILLFECKMAGTNLRQVQMSQLFRYFSVTAARFGVLTDGVQYHFFTYMAQPNIMDNEPFFVFDMLDIKESSVDELKRFTKTAYDEASIVSSATVLKRRGFIKAYLGQQLQKPTEEFVRTCIQGSKVGEARITQTVLDDYTPIIREAMRFLINEQVEARLKSALEREADTPSPDVALPAPVVPEPAVITTADEREAHMIVKAILRDLVDVSRVTMRDAQSYCAIFLDNNNRRAVCRFNFGEKNKSLTVFDDNKAEVRYKIESLDDIYKYADPIRATVKGYISKYE
jgi:predicted type IV restriction endonuclease